MFSNIDATNHQARDNPEPVRGASLRSAWPRPAVLPLGRGHRMAFRTVGDPRGEPWLLLHGGPGSGCQPGMLAPLDLSRQWAIAPDQRGCGASRPRGKTTANTTHALVADLETLRRHLGVERWSLLAGSWGTVVALAYAKAHPQRVQRLVLRGAFALSRREVGGLLQPPVRTLGALGPEPAWPVTSGRSVPAVLARLRQLLQSGTHGVATLHVVRRWSLLESAAAGRGMRRSLRHASQGVGDLPGGGPGPGKTANPVSGPGRAGLAAAIRRDWAQLRRRQRRAQARAHQRGPGRSERAALDKYRVQAHYLWHRGFVRPGELDRAVLLLAQRGVPVDWVHGRFDAICPPQNSRAWAALGARTAPPCATLHQPPSGHLGHEPTMLAALRACVRGRPA